MKRPGTVWCARNKHRLAWVESDPETREAVVCATVVAAGKDKLHLEDLRLSAPAVLGDDPADPYAAHAVMVGCACGGRWSVDLVSVLRGIGQRLERVTGDAFPGISMDR